MKKLIFSILIVLLAIPVSGCFVSDVFTTKNNTGNYLGSYYEDNYVWGGAMNLAWNDLNENILHDKLQLGTTNPVAIEMVQKFNEHTFSKNDLDENSYYVKSGYGQETVNKINQESKLKFPNKSFPDLQIQLNPKDIISYAYFLKEVEYLTQFTEKNVKFQNNDVKGFYAENREQKDNIKIIKYENDDKFIISLELKDGSDQLIVAKGYDMTSPQSIVEEIKKYQPENFTSISTIDIFEMPNIHLDHHRQYDELINLPLTNHNFKEYYINTMVEDIKFDMDYKGARVENQAVLLPMLTSIEFDRPKPKNLILNKPFWIIMKRTSSQNPYFILGVNNEKIMENL
ncbi:MAG: hypothetical protein ACOZAR_01900 [Patescibacteria group bacterium]